jgi:cytochrome c oxidase assembly protein subunit 11
MVTPRQPDPAKNRRVAMMASGVAVAMVGLAYASVPLYSLFCQATGFGGTTQVAKTAPASEANQSITIRFDANIDSGLAWNFHPKELQQQVKIGEVAMAFYVARNTGSEASTGTAVFNVTPPEAGIYFNKISCFCFTEQHLGAGQSVELPVQYFVDPAILDDANTRAIHEITLSYTFYPVNKPAADEQAASTVN